MLSPTLVATFSEVSYAGLVLVTVVAAGLSCAALLSQAVRTSPSQSWSMNFNALVIGASYAIVLVASVIFCINRRLSVRLRLQRVSKVYRTIGRADVPASVHEYMAQEYIRASLISFESLPKGVVHEGWGRPGSKYCGVRFRRALLDTIYEIDTLTRQVIPTHPPLKPHARMLHHFRFIIPLFAADEDGLTPLHYYDSAIQLARNATREPSEVEFEAGIQAAEEIMRTLNECRLEMIEESTI